LKHPLLSQHPGHLAHPGQRKHLQNNCVIVFSQDKTKRVSIGLVFSIFLSVAALLGIKVLDLPVLITILLVILVTIFTLVSMLSLSIGKSPEAVNRQGKHGDKDMHVLTEVLSTLYKRPPEQARTLPAERPHSNLNSSGASGEPEVYCIPPTSKILN
jgi:hypothetical protein